MMEEEYTNKNLTIKIPDTRLTPTLYDLISGKNQEVNMNPMYL
tara:strand:+ start:1097 stop:1225 length:129 start_codon:yes stop_codon:yes gene_type:complete